MINDQGQRVWMCACQKARTGGFIVDAKKRAASEGGGSWGSRCADLDFPPQAEPFLLRPRCHPESFPSWMAFVDIDRSATAAISNCALWQRAAAAQQTQVIHHQSAGIRSGVPKLRMPNFHARRGNWGRLAQAWVNRLVCKLIGGDKFRGASAWHVSC